MPVAAARSRERLRVPLSKKRGEVIWQRGIEAEPPAGDRVGELEMDGVQELARRQRRLVTTIHRITHNGVLDRGQVDANLVGSPRLELQLEQRAALSTA